MMWKIIIFIFLSYVSLCAVLYFFQEKLLFFPEKLEKDYDFNFSQEYDEVNLKAKDGTILNALLFKVPSSKGVIFYLHGNAGSLASWGDIAPIYTDLGYDVFMLDYRGFGKSEGEMKTGSQAIMDVQIAYNYLKESYLEGNITVLGYSLGTGLAAKVAATNQPEKLILQAPYYSLVDVMKHRYSIIPGFLLKYQLNTFEYIKQCEMPIVIFHGDQDEVIYHGSSEKLKAHLKADDQVFFLKGFGHSGMTLNEMYRQKIRIILK